MKRLKKGIVAWFISLCVLSAIASLFYDADGEMPPVLGWIIFFASIYCAVRFSKSMHIGSAKHMTVRAIMDRIDKMKGRDFEVFVAGLMRDLGYQRVKVTPASGDQGVDVIAVKDGKKYAIQCKRYANNLGNKPIQEVNAGKTIYGCDVAAVITNSYFTEGGKEAAQALGVLLWDRDELRKMITCAAFKEG